MQPDWESGRSTLLWDPQGLFIVPFSIPLTLPGLSYRARAGPRGPSKSACLSQPEDFLEDTGRDLRLLKEEVSLKHPHPSLALLPGHLHLGAQGRKNGNSFGSGQLENLSEILSQRNF